MSTTGVAEDAPPEITRGALRKQILDLINQSCDTDSITLITQALALSSSPNSNYTPDKVLQLTFSRTISRNAPQVLTYILSCGADIKDRIASTIGLQAYEHSFPNPLTEIFLSHGYDINYRGRNHQQPLLWQVVYDGDAVRWCLDHGATVVPKDQKQLPWGEFDINDLKAYKEYLERNPYTTEEVSDCLYYCPPILELAARSSTVETFELLRSRGAPLSWRVLHMAVSGRACITRPENPIEKGDILPYCPSN